MKNRYSILFWILGAVILFSALYFFILRFPGYIFYFDSSGSFNYNRPFDQYLFTYTPYDGIEVGIKNRLPIISIIGGLYYLLGPLLHLSAQDVLKIAFVLIFLGAYTAFYLVLPRFYALLWRDKVNSELFSTIAGRFLRVFFSLLYLAVPFFVFRLSMMHMFFLTTFYPLITYVFLQLCEKSKFSWRSIFLLTLLCFFGFSYTNILPYYIVTFLLFAAAAFIAKKSSFQKGVLLRNLVVAGICVILTNVYWVVPYFLKDRPSPGYVVTTSMVNALGGMSTFQNVLLDTSEWFVGQGEKTVVFMDQNKLIAAIQIFGAINVYLFSIFALKSNKRKSYAYVILFLIVSSFFITVKESPLYQYLYEQVVYYDFGWLIREPNRQRFFIAFWTFLLFSLGIITLLKPGDKAEEHKDGYIRWSILFACVSYLVYVGPWFYNTLLYLKPTVVNSDLQQVNSILSKDSSYTFVNTIPSVELYRSSWIDKKYDMADIWNYRLNYYSLSRPPLQLNTVVPVARSKESLVSEMLFWQGDNAATARVLNYLGVGYTLYDKQAIPLFISNPDDKKYYREPLVEMYSDKDYWETTYSGNTFTLLKNISYTSSDSIKVTAEKVVTNAPLQILSVIENESLKGRAIEFLFKDVDEIGPKDKLLVDKNDEFYYLDFISTEDRQKYITYPYDFTKQYGVPIDWGRASSQDKGGAEFSSVLRYHGVRAYQFMAEDKIAYSDVLNEGKLTKATLGSVITTPCREKCSIFAKVLFSRKGGDIAVAVGNNFRKFTTESTGTESFTWQEIAKGVSFTEDKLEVRLESQAVLNAVGGILIVPDSFVSETRDWMSQRTIYSVDLSGETKEVTLPEVDPHCEFETVSYYDTFVPHVAISGFCQAKADMQLKQFQSEFLYVDKVTKKAGFASSIPVVENFQGEIWFFSRVDVTLWVLFILTYVAIIVFAELVLLGHVK